MKSVNWLTVLFSGVGTALLIFGVNIISDRVSSTHPRLVFGTVPPATFVSDKAKVQIHSGFIENSGGRVAENVLAIITIPATCVLTEKTFTPSSKTLKYDAAKQTDVITEISVPSGLNPGERLDFAFLLECDSDRPIEIDLRGKNVVGVETPILSNPPLSVGKLNITTVMILAIAILAVTMMLVRSEDSQRDNQIQQRKHSLSSLVWAYRDIEDNDASLTEAKKLVEADPGDYYVHSVLSLAFGRVGELEKALHEGKLAVALKSKDWYSHYAMASALAQKEEYSQCLEALKKSNSNAGFFESRKLMRFLNEKEQFAEFRKTNQYSELMT